MTLVYRGVQGAGDLSGGGIGWMINQGLVKVLVACWWHGEC